jgi:hypothetical protein
MNIDYEPLVTNSEIQRLKAHSTRSAFGTPKQAAEKLNIRRPAPKGAFDFEGLAVSLKRYPDTKHEFFRNL